MLFHPHLRNGLPGDKHITKLVEEGLAGHKHRTIRVADDSEAVVTPVRYGFRSFDRQWIIPDSRLLNQPNPTLWETHSSKQVYLMALTRYTPTSGPAVTFTGLVPDLDHYNGRGGRAFPLWSDAAAREPNVRPGLLGPVDNWGIPLGGEA